MKKSSVAALAALTALFVVVWQFAQGYLRSKSAEETIWQKYHEAPSENICLRCPHLIWEKSNTKKKTN